MVIYLRDSLHVVQNATLSTDIDIALTAVAKTEANQELTDRIKTGSHDIMSSWESYEDLGFRYWFAVRRSEIRH